MARIAIVGVGAIGGVLAGLLHTANAHEIVLCTRRSLDGLTVQTPEGTIAVEAQNLFDPRQAAPVEWVLVATKTYDAESASAWFAGLCGPETRVAIVQNGVEHRENFAAYLAPERIVPVVIDVPAERLDERTVLQRADAMIRVEQGAAGEAFKALFAGSRAEVELTADFLSVAWRKLCINAAGVVSALTLQPAGVLRDELCGMVALDLVRECVAVARAEGAEMDDATPERVLAGVRAASPDSINSLLADRRAGRSTEIDARNGVIVRRGEKHGIATPTNRMAVALFKAMAR